MRTAPTGTLAAEVMRPARTWVSWRLPPPRSPMTPSWMGRWRIAASAPRWASSRSLSRRTSAPSRCFRTCSRQSRFGASLTAAVATAMSRSGAPLVPRRSRNPRTEDSVSATASGGSSPARPSPRRVWIRSFCSTRYPTPGLIRASTKRAALDPRSRSARSSGMCRVCRKVRRGSNHTFVTTLSTAVHRHNHRRAASRNSRGNVTLTQCGTE